MIADAITRILGREPNFLTEVILQDDGDGPYIREWNAPEPKPTDEEIQVAVSAYEADPYRETRRLGVIPTEVFISTVFAPPASMPDPPTDYTWNRENVVRMLSPAISVRMPKGGMLSGTREDILRMAGWLLTYANTPNTYPPVFVPMEPAADGSFSGGIISQEEYGRVLALLSQYGVQ